MTNIYTKVFNNNTNHKAKQQVPEVDEDTSKIEGSWYIRDWMWYEKRKPKKNLQNHSPNTRKGFITLDTQCPYLSIKLQQQLNSPKKAED